MKAIRVHEYGGPDVMKYEDVAEPKPGKGEAVVKIAAAGLNFIDIYFRTGIYKPPQLPFTPGSEAAGTVVSVGEGVSEVKAGDRVAYAMVLGAYAEYAVVPAWRRLNQPFATACILSRSLSCISQKLRAFSFSESEIAEVGKNILCMDLHCSLKSTLSIGHLPSNCRTPSPCR